LARERLVDQLARVRARIDAKITEAGLEDYSPNLDRFPLAGVPSGEELADQVASLEALIPEIGPFASTLRTVGLRPNGDKVSGVFQHIGGGLDNRIGLTLLVTDLRGKLQPEIFTLWRPLATDTSFVPTPDGSTSVGVGSLEDQEPASLPPIAMKEYVALLDPAMRWLALEVARRSILQRWQSRNRLARFPRPGRTADTSGPQIRVKIHNFFGLLYQASAWTFQLYKPQFLDLAIHQFTEATSLSPKIYQPFENLAETCLIKIPRRAEADPKLLKTARDSYSTAFELTSHLPREERQTVQRRIIPGQALVDLLSAESTRLERAKDQIRRVESDDLALAPKDDKDGLSLYQLACWYGLALAKEVLPAAEARTKARLYLAYCLARSEDFWEPATQDDDLELVRDGLDRLKHKLRETQENIQGLATLDGAEFERVLVEVMDSADWR
jgi:hypothetical protein